MSLSFKFKQTPELTYDFMNHYRKNNRSFKILIVVVIILFVVTMVRYFMNSEDTETTLWSVLMPFILIFGLWYYVIPYFMKRQLARAPQPGGMTDDREMIFSEEEIIVKTNVSDAKFTWDGILNLGESDLCYYFYIAKNQALILPKSCMTDDGERTVLLELLEAKGLL